jgi:hypothetical protein
MAARRRTGSLAYAFAPGSGRAPVARRSDGEACAFDDLNDLSTPAGGAFRLVSAPGRVMALKVVLRA